MSVLLIHVSGVLCFVFFFFKQKTAYEMRISDWSSDVCSSDLDQRIQGPADDVAPLVVALAHQRTQRLLGDDLRQDDVILGVVERRARGRQAGKIGRASCRERGCQYV